MPEITLESLAARVDAIERRLGFTDSVILPTRDWRSVVGISEENEFTRSMYAEMQLNREAERAAARSEEEE